MKNIIFAAIVLALTSCSVANKHGVLKETSKGRWVSGNAKHFQQRHDAKVNKKVVAVRW